MVLLKKGRKANISKARDIPVPQAEDLDDIEELSSGMEDNDDEMEDEKKILPTEFAEESEDEGNDSDKELQIALRDGLLKSDRLNYIVHKKRAIINKKDEIVDKIASFSKKLPWIETLDVTTQCTLTNEMIDNDFERELQFYKQAEKAVQIAVPKLLAMNVKILRPEDYYAEMAKSDGHMQKIRKRLLKIKEGKDRQDAIRRMREEKKFATKVQKKVLEDKNNEKKKLMEAVKKHKKGMKQQLEDMLNNVKKFGLGEDEGPGFGSSSGPQGGERGGRARNFKREFKSQKFGYGGRKKGQKRNNKDSFENVDGGFKGGRGGGFRGGRGGRGGGGGRGRGGSRGSRR